jgi:hypothetical protein
MEGVQTQDQTHNEFDNIDMNIDDEMSVEAKVSSIVLVVIEMNYVFRSQELEYLEEFNTDWVNNKISLSTNI